MNCNKSKKQKSKHFLIICEFRYLCPVLGEVTKQKDASSERFQWSNAEWRAAILTLGDTTTTKVPVIHTLLAKLFSSCVVLLCLPSHSQSARWVVCLPHRPSLPAIHSFSNSLPLPVQNSHLQLQKIFLSNNYGRWIVKAAQFESNHSCCKPKIQVTSKTQSIHYFLLPLTTACR